MKAKAMRLSYILPLLMMGGITFFTGCEQGKDLYNPDLLQEEAKKAFPVKDIDPDHTWETSVLCNATVSVNEKAGDTYTIKVYTANPYNTNGNAALLATTTVADSKATNFKFDIPAALQQVYVMKVNGAGYSAAVPATVENGILKVDFGGKDATTTRTVMTKGSEGNFFQPETFGEEYFPTKAPEVCVEFNENAYQQNNAEKPYKLTGTLSDFNPWAGGTFYIEGNVTIESWKEPNRKTNFYILPEAKLTLKMGFNHRPNSILSIGENATLEATRTLKGEAGSKCLNKGTMIATNIEVTNAYLHNEGETKTETLLLTNDQSKVCNATNGKMEIGKLLKIEGDAHFLNDVNGLVVVGDKGETIINCTNGSWENAGHFTTSDMKISAWNNNIKNSCWLTIKDNFSITEGGIINDSYVQCKDLYLKNAVINMTSKSFFEVTEEAEFDYNPYDKGFGFIATTTGGEKALLKMKKAIRNEKEYNNITYRGNLYIACDEHFEEKENQGNYYKLTDGAQMTGAANANISIPKSECNPGYDGTPDGGGDDKPLTYAYAFEDMMQEVGDYDFNDVVLYVTVPYKKNGKTYIDATLKAAGASKLLAVHFKNQTIFSNVHEALGVSVGTITNTGSATGTTKTECIGVESDFDLTTDGDFYISDGQREIHIPRFTSDFKKGDAPYAIRVASSNWKWPKERISIEEAYPQFVEWAKDASQEPRWYETPEENHVMPNN